jgi:hypothetical protein
MNGGIFLIRSFIILSLLTLIFCAWRTPAQSLSDSQFLSVNQALKLWSNERFEAHRFKQGDEALRSRMVIDLILRKLYIGQKLSWVERELGAPNAEYDSKRVPAYRLQPSPDEVYELVFLPDYTGSKVEEVRIHKSTKAALPKSAMATSKLPVVIEGALAKKIFEQLLDVPEINGTKTGAGIFCAKATLCTFHVSTKGELSP